jgi:hypothetical protein
VGETVEGGTHRRICWHLPVFWVLKSGMTYLFRLRWGERTAGVRRILWTLAVKGGQPVRLPVIRLDTELVPDTDHTATMTLPYIKSGPRRGWSGAWQLKTRYNPRMLKVLLPQHMPD